MYIYGFIDEVFDLAWYSLAANSKYCTFSRSKEILWAQLERVVLVEHLLGRIKEVVSLDIEREQGATFSAGYGGEKSPEGKREAAVSIVF